MSAWKSLTIINEKLHNSLAYILVGWTGGMTLVSTPTPLVALVLVLMDLKINYTCVLCFMGHNSACTKGRGVKRGVPTVFYVHTSFKQSPAYIMQTMVI